MKNARYTLIFIICLLISKYAVYSQSIPHPVENTGVYEFLDELANCQIIDINSAIKPYYRSFIEEKLNEARIFSLTIQILTDRHSAPCEI